MNTNLTNLRESLNNFKTMMEQAFSELLDTANKQRREFLDLRDRMSRTHSEITELGEVMRGAVDTFDLIGYQCDSTAERIADAIESGAARVPTCNYEELVEFCDECGKPIANGDPYIYTATGEYLCADCCSGNDDEEAPVEADAECADQPMDAETDTAAPTEATVPADIDNQ